MNILDLIQQDNIQTRHVSQTKGGEFHGPCPKCGGKDRFIVNPFVNPEKGGYFYCRQCHFSGDAITYLVKHRGMKYSDACIELNIQPDFKYNPKPTLPQSTAPPWEPREIHQVPSAWSEKAEAVLFEAYKNLLSSSGKIYREYLAARGISIQTIKQARIGLIQSPLNFDRQSWGLSLPDKKDALNRQIWVPEGLIIPMFSSSKVVRLRIRQDNPKNSDRYILVAGSATAYLQHNPLFNPQIPSMVLEAELDGWLIYQAAGDLINVFSAGNSTTRPDLETHKKLKQTPLLLALDNDTAGQHEAKWWRKQYPASLVWPSRKKDPGEDFQAGFNIRAWVESGIEKLLPKGPQKEQTKQEIKPEIKTEILLQTIKKQPITQVEHQLPPQQPTCFGKYCCVHLLSDPHGAFDLLHCGLFKQPDPDPENKISIFSMDSCPKGNWEVKA